MFITDNMCLISFSTINFFMYPGNIQINGLKQYTL